MAFRFFSDSERIAVVKSPRTVWFFIVSGGCSRQSRQSCWRRALCGVSSRWKPGPDNDYLGASYWMVGLVQHRVWMFQSMPWSAVIINGDGRSAICRNVNSQERDPGRAKMFLFQIRSVHPVVGTHRCWMQYCGDGVWSNSHFSQSCRRPQGR